LYFIKLDVYPDPTFSLGDIIFVPTTFESPGGCGNILLYPDSITPEVSGQVFYPTDSLTWRFLPYFTPGSWEVLAIDTPTIEVNQGGDYQYLVSGPSCGSDNCFFAVPYEMTTCIECNNGEGANLPSLPGSDSATQLVLTMNNIRGGNTISFCSNTDFSNFPITFGLYQLDQNDSLVKRIIPAFGRWDISAPAVFPKLLPTLPPTPIYHSFLEHFYSIVNVTSSGWIHVEFSVCAPPDTQNILFTIRDSFYIDLREPPNFEFIFDASTNKLCPGDTMIVHYGISEDYPFTVEAPQALSINTVNQEALFIFQGYIMMKSNFFDLNSGCQVEKVAYFNVEYKQAPQIIMNPSSGRKCPEDSILLQAQPGLETYWFGPDGDTISTSNSIYVTAPGAYYYNQIDFDQCPLLSNYREVRNITAFITDSIITSNICANQPAIIRLAPDTNLNYHWLPPLSGSDTIKYIYQPGNYAVSVELCSNLDTLRFTVSEGLENATIQLVSSPAVLCEGGIIQFATNPLATETIWYPGEVFTDTFTVSSPGFISVLVRDTLGCELTSNRVVTEYPTPPIPNFVSVEEACPGVPITITSTGNYPVRWFSLPDSVEIGSGNSISVDVLQNGQMIGAYTYNPSTQCRSEMIVQSLTLLTLVSPGFLPAERLFCKDDTLITSPQSVMGIGSGYWTGPNNWASTGDQLIIPDITPTQAGVYTYTPIADSGYCALETLNILLEERQLETPNFSFPDSLCEGQNMQLNVDQLNDYLYNWAGPSGSSNLNTWNIEDVPTGFTGKYYISSKDSNCIRVDSFTVFVSSMPPFNPILLTPDYVCNEDTLFLYNGDSLNTANAAILWGGVPSFQYLSPHAVFIPGFNFASNTVITLQYGINQCKSAVTFLSPFIVPQPEFSFFSDSIKVCKSSDFTLSAPIPGVSYRWNTGSNLPSIMPAIDGWYSLEITDSLGCQFTDSMRLDFLQCDSNLTANTFSPNGDGVNDKLYFKVEGGEIYKVHIYERWGSFLKEIVGSDANWDGTDEQGKMMPASTYFYVLEVDFFDGELKKFQGCISLFH